MKIGKVWPTIPGILVLGWSLVPRASTCYTPYKPSHGLIQGNDALAVSRVCPKSLLKRAGGR